MDMKVLQFQNKKLAERIEQRKRAEEELHKRIEQLENRQRTDDAVLMIVNRYWNQVCVIDVFLTLFASFTTSVFCSLISLCTLKPILQTILTQIRLLL